LIQINAKEHESARASWRRLSRPSASAELRIKLTETLLFSSTTLTRCSRSIFSNFSGSIAAIFWARIDSFARQGRGAVKLGMIRGRTGGLETHLLPQKKRLNFIFCGAFGEKKRREIRMAVGG
jgi:hypothetical protein